MEGADLYRYEMLRRCLSAKFPNLENIQSEAKAKNEQNSLDLVVHLNEHSILRNIDDGKVEMF